MTASVNCDLRFGSVAAVVADATFRRVLPVAVALSRASHSELTVVSYLTLRWIRPWGAMAGNPWGDEQAQCESRQLEREIEAMLPRDIGVRLLSVGTRPLVDVLDGIRPNVVVMARRGCANARRDVRTTCGPACPVLLVT